MIFHGRTLTVSSWLVAVTAALAAAACLAADNDFFADIDVEVEAPPVSTWSLDGWIEQTATYGLSDPGEQFSRQRRGLSRLTTSAQLELNYNPSPSWSYRLAARGSHDWIYAVDSDRRASAAERDELGSRAQFRDAYFDMQLRDQLFLRVGNQIVAWGEAESLTITDLVNRQDRRTPGQADLEDTRLQVPAARLSRTQGDWLIEAVLTHRAGSDDVAPAGNEFDPYIRLRLPGIHLDEIAPRTDTEFLVRVQKAISGGEIALVMADVNSNDYAVDSIGVADDGLHLKLRQDRFQAIGLSATTATGFWVLRAEIGAHLDKAMQPAADAFFVATDGWTQRDQLLSMIGFDYSGFGNATLQFEIDHVRTLGNVDGLAVPSTQTGFSARALWSSQNDRLSLQGDWVRLPGRHGDIARLSSSYKVTDHVALNALLVGYFSATPDAPLYDYRHNDAIEFGVRILF